MTTKWLNLNSPRCNRGGIESAVDAYIFDSQLRVKIEPIEGLFLTARAGHFCPASVLSFACPKESTKEKGSLSGGANDLRGLRCF